MASTLAAPLPADARMLLRKMLRSVALLASLALAACGGDADVAPARGTPREALAEYNGAMCALDKERARSWVLTGDLETRFFELSFVVAQSIQRFQNAVRQRFGEDGLERVMTSPGGQRLLISSCLTPDELEALSIRQQGDVAVAYFPDGRAMRIERREGKWRVDVVGSNVPDEIAAELKRLDYEREALAPVLDRAAVQAQRPETTLDGLEQLVDGELERAFAAQPVFEGSEPSPR